MVSSTHTYFRDSRPFLTFQLSIAQNHAPPQHQYSELFQVYVEPRSNPLNKGTGEWATTDLSLGNHSYVNTQELFCGERKRGSTFPHTRRKDKLMVSVVYLSH